MKLKTIYLIAASCLTFSMTAHANEVALTAEQPLKVTYQVVHKNNNGKQVLGETKIVNIDKNKNAIAAFALDNFDKAGVKIIAVDGHVLPPIANEFDKAKQCSITTDKNKTTGSLAFRLTAHEASCRTYGGVYGQ